MTINSKIEKAINEQIREEYESANLYLAMASYFQSINLPGFATWMKVQYQEEQVHMLKFFDYIVERNGRAIVPALKAPKTEWSSPLNTFDEALKHENHITGCVNRLMDLAVTEKDYATQNLLQWYVNEQVEEESNATAIVEKLKMIKESMGGLLYLDKELNKRGKA